MEGSELLGTSAGSWVAACLATGTPFETLCALPPVRVPNLRAGKLQSVAVGVFGDARSSAGPGERGSRFHRATRAAQRGSTIACRSGRRVVRGADPVRPRSHRGPRATWTAGSARLVSADQAPAARHLLVVAPLAGPMFGRAGRVMESLLNRELAALAARQRRNRSPDPPEPRDRAPGEDPARPVQPRAGQSGLSAGPRAGEPAAREP